MLCVIKGRKKDGFPPSLFFAQYCPSFDHPNFFFLACFDAFFCVVAARSAEMAAIGGSSIAFSSFGMPVIFTKTDRLGFFPRRPVLLAFI
jgi:hypothetical protein